MQNRILSYYLIFSVCVPAAFLVNVHRDVTDVTRERLPYRYCTMRSFCWISNNRSGVASISA